MTALKKIAIGIDLGTTYSCVGIWKSSGIEIIANEQGSRTTPSCVSFNDNERLVGGAAKACAASNPKNTIFDSKRLIGRKFDDPSLQSDMKMLSYDIIKGSNNVPVIKVNYKKSEKKFRAEEISAMILGKMKKIADRMGITIAELNKIRKRTLNNAINTISLRKSNNASVKKAADITLVS